jgi:hypothetical protein
MARPRIFAWKTFKNNLRMPAANPPGHGRIIQLSRGSVLAPGIFLGYKNFVVHGQGVGCLLLIP